MNKLLGAGVILILIAMAFIISRDHDSQPRSPEVTNPSKEYLLINDKKIEVEVARTSFDREQGLSGRQSLAADSGMLFVFEQPGRHGFWMKETYIPLDFIWIRDGKITEITPNVPTQLNVPLSQLKSYLPAEPVDWMLEVNAGFAAKHGIKVGDSVSLTNN